MDLNWKRTFLTGPIIECVYNYKDSADPLMSFMEHVYLNVDEIADFFDEDDIKPQLLSKVYVNNTLIFGLDCIFQEDFMDTLYELPIVNEEIFDEISTIFSITDGITQTLQETGRIKHNKLVQRATEKINQKMYVTETMNI